MLLVILTFMTTGLDRAISAPPNGQQGFTVYVAPKANVTRVDTADSTTLTVTATADLWLHCESTASGSPSQTWGRHVLCRKPTKISIPHRSEIDAVTVLTFSGI